MTSRAAPTVEILVDGRPMRGPERLASLRVASRLSLPAQCELLLHLGHGEHPWPPEWTVGTGLSVRVVGDDTDLFAGEVTALELRHRPDGAAEFRVRGYDRLHRLRRRQRLRVFEDVTPADLVAELVRDLDLELLVDESGPRLDRVVQHRQSDLDLLREVTAEAGLYLALRGRRLRLFTSAGYGDPVELRRGHSLWELRVEVNADRVADRVTAIGWHPQRAEVFTERAGTARGPGGPLTPAVAAERTLVDRPVRGAGQLAAIAQADLDVDAGRAVTVAGVADGGARLWAGHRISVTGVPAPPAGEYVLGTVTYTVDANGYLASFTSELPAPPEPLGGGGTSLTLGRVTSVADPDRRGRVQVSLPTLGDLDVGWLPVLHPGAGPDRGLVILPDVGDTVVVALPYRTPAHGLVLGSVYGTVRPPDPGVEGDAVRRWSLRTRQGQSVVVDDAEQLIRVQSRNGSHIELGPDRMRLHATTDLVIEAPGQGITVRARSVDFERAG